MHSRQEKGATRMGQKQILLYWANLETLAPQLRLFTNHWYANVPFVVFVELKSQSVIVIFDWDSCHEGCNSRL